MQLIEIINDNNSTTFLESIIKDKDEKSKRGFEIIHISLSESQSPVGRIHYSCLILYKDKEQILETNRPIII